MVDISLERTFMLHFLCTCRWDRVRRGGTYVGILQIALLVEQDVSVLCRASVLLCGSKKHGYAAFRYRFHILVIKQQPLILALGDANVMPVVEPSTYVDHCSKEGVQDIWIVCIISGVAELQLDRESHTIVEFVHSS